MFCHFVILIHLFSIMSMAAGKPIIKSLFVVTGWGDTAKNAKKQQQKNVKKRPKSDKNRYPVLL